MGKTFDSKIYGTNPDWGRETFYCNATELKKIVASLKEIGDDWKNTSADDANEYNLARELDSGEAIYEGEFHTDDYGKNGRYSALLFAHAESGFYRFVEQFDSLAAFEADQVATSAAASILGHKGGSATSEAKTAAARINGKKGGRPRKQIK